jgi:hypothetical protein
VLSSEWPIYGYGPSAVSYQRSKRKKISHRSGWLHKAYTCMFWKEVFSFAGISPANEKVSL